MFIFISHKHSLIRICWNMFALIIRVKNVLDHLVIEWLKVGYFCDSNVEWVASVIQTKAFFMSTIPPPPRVGRPPSSWDALSGFPRCSLPDPWVLSANTSSLCRGNVLEHLQMALVKERKEAMQIRTVDLAASSKSRRLDLSLATVSFLFHRPGCCLSSRLIRI